MIETGAILSKPLIEGIKARVELARQHPSWDTAAKDYAIDVPRLLARVDELEQALRDCHRSAVGYQGAVAVYNDGYADTAHNKDGGCRYCAVLGVRNVEATPGEGSAE